jgi:hypothetical protein
MHRYKWALSNVGKASGNLIVYNNDCAVSAKNNYSGWKNRAQHKLATHTGHYHQKYSRYIPEYFPVGSALAKNMLKKAPKNERSNWTRNIPIQPRGMVLARDNLFVCGWRDSVEALFKDGQPVNKKHLDMQEAVLQVLSVETGDMLSEYTLGAHPVFDGMIAAAPSDEHGASGCLYIAMKDGRLVCWGGEK